MNERLQAALEYARLGWSVIPLRFEGSVEDRKKPLLLSWEVYQKKAATEQQIETWWQQWPSANVGLVTGAVSGFVAIDLDGDGAAALLTEAGIDLRTTATVQTARGRHYLYRHPGGKVSNRARLLDDGHGSGVDIRGDGGYICFTAGHQVISRPNGSPGPRAGFNKLVNIERIKPSDVILGYDETTGQAVETVVQQIGPRIVQETLVIKFGLRQGVIRLTAEHPLFTTRGWVRAGDIRVGDELFHVGAATLNLPIATYHAPKGSQPPSRRDYKTKPYKQSVPSHRNRGMTGYEQFVLSLAREAGIPLQYVGDGRLVINSGEFRLQPDFIIEGTNKLVEVSMDWLKHRLTGAPDTALRRMNGPQRVELFKAAGYDCLFIDATQWMTGYNANTLALIDGTRKALVEFAGNGLRVEFVTKLVERVEVFNMHCEPFNNYFVKRLNKGGKFLLAHNCAPPSVHGTGVVYTWERPPSSLASLPTRLQWLLTQRSQRPHEDRAPDWFQAAWQGAPEGQRNEMAARLAGYWLHVTHGNEEATYRAMEYWAGRCTPAMELQELQTTIRSVARLEAAKEREAAVPTETPRLTVHLRDAMAQLVDALEHEPPAFIPTPFPGLNMLLCGGLVPGELYYLAAKGGFGKTAFALDIFRHVARTRGVLGVSREMSVFALSRRLMAQESGVSASRLRQHRLESSDWGRIVDAQSRFYDRYGWFSERVQTVDEIKLALNETTNVKLIVVDYLQLLQAKGIDRRERIETISRDLKALAVDCQVAVLCLSAVTARGEHNKAPGPHWLRESGMLEHDADVILLLDQPDETNKRERNLIIAKARDAETGTVPLLFTPEIVHFVERKMHYDA